MVGSESLSFATSERQGLVKDACIAGDTVASVVYLHGKDSDQRARNTQRRYRTVVWFA